MTAREQHRAWALARILRGELTMLEGAERLGLSERHLWRLRTAFEQAGPAGLVHGNRGRPSTRRIDDHRRASVIELRRTTYGEVNDTHLCRAPRRARRDRAQSRDPPPDPPRGRHRTHPGDGGRRSIGAAGSGCPPRACSSSSTGAGTTGSRGAGPWLTLVGAIDDATGTVPAATFRDQEDAAGYLEILRATVVDHGLPGAVYHNRHGAFAPTDTGRVEPGAPASLSQVGRALVELGIGSIVAGSPQAKGRIERLWGTFQDRLVVELRLARVTDRAGANEVLATYLPRHNARFAVPAVDPVPAWRPVPAGVRLERVLVFKYTRKIARDNTLRLDGRVLQLPRGTGGSNYAGKRVEVHVRLDGSIVAFDGERELVTLPAPADPVQLRAQDVLRAEPGLVPPPATIPWTPPPSHPWRRVRSDTKLYQQRLTKSPGS